MYVANTSDRKIIAYNVLQDGTLAGGRVFADVAGHPDGIKVDSKGNLYVATGSSALRVYDSSGKHLGAIFIPGMTSNCCFGGVGNRTLFVTAGTAVYRVQMKVEGLKAHSGQKDIRERITSR